MALVLKKDVLCKEVNEVRLTVCLDSAIFATNRKKYVSHPWKDSIECRKQVRLQTIECVSPKKKRAKYLVLITHPSEGPLMLS